MLTFSLRHLSAVTLFLFFTAARLHAEAVSTFSIEPAPGWIVPVQYQSGDVQGDAKGGLQYQLVDGQWLAGTVNQPRQQFRHFREKILNQAGLEQESELYLYHNQDYQTLALHQLDIIRDGQRIDKLPGLLVDSFRSEDQANNLIYTGGITTHLIVDDLRVGDELEYSYTIAGSNPVYQQLFGAEMRLSWGVPVEQVSYRLLWAGDQPLHLHYRNTGLKVRQGNHQGLTAYTIETRNTQPIGNNSEKPGWYDGGAYAFLSGNDEWADIERWAIPMYQDAYSQSDAITQIAADIRRQHGDPADQIAAALAYVQNEIRYLGLEMGQNSHRPTAADETLQLRYGDCKDKAVLFVSLLKALNVKAWPALVNTDIGPDLLSYPPSHRLFDHVITYVELNGQGYWLDPTRRNQGDDLSHVYQPYYGHALVIGAGDNALRAMQPHRNSLLKIHDDLYLGASASDAVQFVSATTMTGWFAENFVNKLERSNLEERAKVYLNFYKSFYPGTESTAPLSYERSKRELVATEHYSILNFWEDNNDRFERTLYPSTIRDYLDVPEETERTTPYGLSFPNQVDEVVTVHFADDNWFFNDADFNEDNDFFRYQRLVRFDQSGRTLTLSYRYEALQDHVPAARMADYTAAINRARDESTYGIFMYANGAAAGTDEEEDSLLNDPAITILVVASVVALVMVVVLTSWFMAMGKEELKELAYYPLPLWQFLVLYFITFGLYPLFWLYRNWQYVRRQDQSRIQPGLRAVFGILFFYPLYRRIGRDYNALGHQSFLTHGLVAGVLALLFAVASVTDKIVNTVALPLLVPLIALLPALLLINHQNAAEPSRLRWRHWLLACVSLPFLMLVIAQDLYLIPAGNVVEGNVVSHSDRKFMARSGVLPADEHLLYFYSDAYLDIRQDGNGFTEDSVFSYWMEPDDRLSSRQVALSEVKDIRVTFAEQWNENTLITIVPDNGPEFVLYVGNTDKRDRLFVKELKAQWHQKRFPVYDDGQASSQ
ncbi:DUF3857 domain-containing transglutaminase family protein [Thalassolituus sp. LLYu03]|uniref:DUF3857 domain-containing transglutaminase family protein n=1 Tax=Thalassolituus sp. LLYu03 TaxID=3421656 RepID=UPI003D28B52F